jgi:septum formation protein
VNEDFSPEMPLAEVAPDLARRKAETASALITSDEIILAADSVVILNDTIFNKPADYQEAFHMLSQLSGNMHTVITGVCLWGREQQRVFSGVSRVYFAPLTDEEIDFYIQTCRPFDKAGAYGVQEWIGHCKIERIEGTYSNVMGLPVHLVYEHLRDFVPGWQPTL